MTSNESAQQEDVDLPEGQEERQKVVRDRAATEARLLDVARDLVEQEGLLSGITLLDVARQSKVNRGQIYQYFGTRRELFRQALRRFSWWPESADVDWDRIFRLPFSRRRSELFSLAIEYSTFLKLGAILVLDKDPAARIFPLARLQVEASKKDQADGNLRGDVDPTAAHIMTVATYLGYVVFREQFAKEFELTLEELDRNALPVYNAMLEGLTPQ